MQDHNILSALQQAHADLEAGRSDQARRLCLSVIDRAPGNADALQLLGQISSREGNDNDAANYFLRALRARPDDASLNFRLGTTLGKLGKFDEAIGYLSNAVQQQPGNWRALNCLGLALQYADRLDESLSCYRQSIAINPDHAATYSNMADTLKYKGDIDGAVKYYRTALRLDPTLYPAHHALAFCRKFDKDDKDIHAMESLLTAADITDKQKMHLNYALAKAYEDTGNFDRSFSHLEQANRYKRSTFDFNVQDVVQILEKPAQLFNPDLIDQFPDSGFPDRTPIFIIGMPRSGSTLVEQILSSHPDVHGAGEIHDFYRVLEKYRLNVFKAEFDQGVNDLTVTDLREIGEQYTQRLQNYTDDSQHITDKFLQNFMLLGIIRLALPNARIIHCVRDPVDTCLSCYKQMFRKFHLYSYDLAELGTYYRHYENLMQHWRAVLPGSFLDFHYEDLIDDQRGQTEKLLDYCGLDWNDACLNYHRNRRAVMTASDSQVRQSIYKSSVRRWKRYEKHLQPLLDALDYRDPAHGHTGRHH